MGKFFSSFGRKKNRFAVYAWNAWEQYAICEWRPRAYKIEAHPHDDVADVLGRVRPGTRDFLMHINLSRQALFPKQRSELVAALREKGIRVLNADACDITKSHVQAECKRLGLPTTAAARDGDPDEKLMLKSECNHGGLNERLLDLETRDRLGLPPESAVLDGNLDYPVTTRAKLTDEWDDPGLAIERFVECSREVYYRAYLMLGRLVISRFVPPASNNGVHRIVDVRARDNFHYEDCSRLLDAPDTGDELSPRLKWIVASFLAGIQIDFAAVDVVEDDHDNFFIVDLNTTPYWGVPAEPDMTAFLRKERRP